MSRRPWDAEPHRSQILDLINQGYGLGELAACLGISTKACRYALDRLGIPRPDTRPEQSRERLFARHRDPAYAAANAARCRAMNEARDPWLYHLPKDWKKTRYDLRKVGIPEAEIRRQIDVLRAREAAA